MATPKTIPISPNIPAQRFSIVLNEIAYNMCVVWNSRSQFFTLDIADENDVVLKANIALRCGLDLLSPFNLGMGRLYAVDMTQTGQEPTLENIGSDVFLFNITDDE